MTSQERTLQQKRIERYNALDDAANKIHTALERIKPDSDGPFTGNASKVKSVNGIRISFYDGEVVSIEFKTMGALHGWPLSQALKALLEEIQQRIWKEMEAI